LKYIKEDSIDHLVFAIEEYIYVLYLTSASVGKNNIYTQTDTTMLYDVLRYKFMAVQFRIKLILTYNKGVSNGGENYSEYLAFDVWV
jgi:hypothetical protein